MYKILRPRRAISLLPHYLSLLKANLYLGIPLAYYHGGFLTVEERCDQRGGENLFPNTSAGCCQIHSLRGQEVILKPAQQIQ